MFPRNKFIFLSRKIAILLFFAMFLYAGLIKLFGENIFPPKYLLVIFFSSVIFLILTFIPGQINKEYWYAWFFFLSLVFIFLGIVLGVILIYFFQIPRESFIIKICSGVMILGIIGFFSSFFIGNKKRDLKRTREETIQSFKKISENLGLNWEDKSNDRVIKLIAEGNYKLGYILLYIENELWRDLPGVGRDSRETRKMLVNQSSILIETNQEIKPFKIESYHEAVKIDGLDESIKSKINDFIQKNNLNYLDFTINIVSPSEDLFNFFIKWIPESSYKNFKWVMIINIQAAIEESDLWNDYIKLAEILLTG